MEMNIYKLPESLMLHLDHATGHLNTKSTPSTHMLQKCLSRVTFKHTKEWDPKSNDNRMPPEQLSWCISGFGTCQQKQVGRACSGAFLCNLLGIGSSLALSQNPSPGWHCNIMPLIHVASMFPLKGVELLISITLHSPKMELWATELSNKN